MTQRIWRAPLSRWEGSTCALHCLPGANQTELSPTLSDLLSAAQQTHLISLHTVRENESGKKNPICNCVSMHYPSILWPLYPFLLFIISRGKFPETPNEKEWKETRAWKLLLGFLSHFFFFFPILILFNYPTKLYFAPGHLCPCPTPTVWAW